MTHRRTRSNIGDTIPPAISSDHRHGITRRSFAQLGSSLAAYTILPRGAKRDRTQSSKTWPLNRDAPHADPDADRIRQLLLRAVDAAKSAGATYADARVVRVIDQTVEPGYTFGPDWRASVVAARLGTVEETERHGISVRALVNGAWGFTASPWWTDDESVTLARNAVAQARDNSQWTTSKVELAPAPAVTGTWTTPYRIDPFSIPVEEKLAVMRYASQAYHQQYAAADHHTEHAEFGRITCQRTTRGLATSEGTYTVQHFYKTALRRRFGEAQLQYVLMRNGRLVPNPEWGKEAVSTLQDPIPPGTGWEVVADANLWDLSREAAEAAYASLVDTSRAAPARAVEVGQYTIVMDAGTVGRLVDVTVGRATDIDRIIGDEANDDGTSYLGTDPLALAGTYSFGSPLLTVRATRAGSLGGVTGLPTVRWDDEGVVPMPFTLVQDGMLQDFATTRDRATMLAPYYARNGRAMASNGCAVSGDRFGFDLTTVGPPTLVMSPGSADTTTDAMISSVTRGILLTDGYIQADFQLRQITIGGMMREIVNGRVGRPVTGGLVQIDAAQLWKNLHAIGGPPTMTAVSETFSKGVPAEMLETTVVAVPALFTGLSVVRAGR